MKSAAFLATCGAILAVASPILQGRRLYIKTDIVTEWKTVTVTEGDTVTVFRRPGDRPKPTTTPVAESSSTPVAPPPPPPPPPSSTPKPVIEAPAPTPDPVPEPTPVVDTPKPNVQAAQPSPQPSPDPVPVPAPAPSPSKAEPAQPSDYSSTALYHHNVHRFNHSASALEWSSDHAGYAKQLAETCKFAHDTTIGGGGYGQNLAMWGSSGDPEAFGATGSVARAASNGWYNGELNDFPAGDYGKGSPDMSNFKKWGHYSQLVWKGTQKVGCHSQFCKPGTMSSIGSWYTVCNYFPAGNMGGAFAENVLRPQGQAKVVAPEQ